MFKLNRPDRPIPGRRRRLSLLAVVAALVLALSAGTGAGASSPRPPSPPKPTIVLVHGAFADASSWNDVIERLQDRGYPVIAPANPLRGVASDAAYVRSVLDTIEGPIVLVAHSYGGTVLSNAATGHPGVKALVYIAAFAPDVGESVIGLSAMNPGSLLGPDTLVIRPHPGGADGYIDPSAFREVFAADVPRDQAAVMAVTQRPADLAAHQQPSGEPAWKTIPSWYLVASRDNAIPPATQRFMAQRAGATTVEVGASHAVAISQPRPVTQLILDAARSTN